MQFILSTCGTSLLTNGRDQEERSLVNRHTNVKYRDDIDKDIANRLSTIIEQVHTQLKSASIQDVAKMSAELNALIKFYEGKAPSVRDHHILLCTDTWLGEESAKLAEMWLNEEQGCKNVQIKRQGDLQTASLHEFQLALSDLIKWSGDENGILSYQQGGYRIVFNLTGGFKSVQGFLQTLAMFYADEVVYIFESGEELLRIPRMPIVMDAVPIVEKHLTTFRRLGLNLQNDDVNDIPETMLMTIDQTITLSPWGQLIWEQSKKTIYAERVYPSPSDKLRYSRGFEQDVQQLPQQRHVIVNERIDDLVRYLETDNYNLRSLDFKQLKGDPRPPSTHECDAWHDQDARRMFGHFDDAVFVLDSLGEALH